MTAETSLNTAPLAAPKIGCFSLFSVFSRMALCGFGGVLPFAYRSLVERERWLTANEFSEYLSLSQMLPGPTICNVGLMVGHRYAGARGALAALAGLIVFPFLVVIALGIVYQRFGNLDIFRNALSGMMAVAAGLILATAVKMAIAMYKGGAPHRIAMLQTVLLLLAFIGLGLLGGRLIVVFLALVPLGALLLHVMRTKNER